LHSARRGRRLYTSALTAVEARRAMASLVAGRRLSPAQAAELLGRALRLIAGAGGLPVTKGILAGARRSFPHPLNPLDGPHVATAAGVQGWPEVTELVMLSRDHVVRENAAALGMQLA